MRPHPFKHPWPRSIALAGLVAISGAWLWADERRTWTDATGKFTVSAELISESDGKVNLKRSDGTEITLPIERLSSKDQHYLAQRRELKNKTTQANSKATVSSAGEVKDIPKLREIAENFYEDLRTETRTVVRELITAESQKLAGEELSALVTLPAPDEGAKAIRIGKAKVTGKSAEVSVVMLTKGEPLRTTLHLRKVDDQWQVFAMSAKLRGDEVTVDLETRFEKPTADKSDRPTRPSLEDLIGKPIELTGLTLDGRSVSLAQYKGKVVLIDFWATWCGPCRAEIPNIAANYQRFKNSGFEVIAVSVDKDLEELAAFVAQEHPPWVVLADYHTRNPVPQSDKFGISGIPAFVLVGKDGKVAAVNCRGEKLQQCLSRLLP